MSTDLPTSGHDAGAPAESPEDREVDAFRQASDRVERLLGELRTSTAPAAWVRIQELVSSLTFLYGTGFRRLLETFAAGKGIDPRTRAELCDDPVVVSLLLLHGLHPVPPEERVAHAIDRVRRAIGPGGGTIEAPAPDASGTLKVRLSGDWSGSPVPASGIEAALRRAIEEAAPELLRLDIATEGTFPASTKGLVQIDLSRSRHPTGNGVAP